MKGVCYSSYVVHAAATIPTRVMYVIQNPVACAKLGDAREMRELAKWHNLGENYEGPPVWRVDIGVAGKCTTFLLSANARGLSVWGGSDQRVCERVGQGVEIKVLRIADWRTTVCGSVTAALPVVSKCPQVTVHPSRKGINANSLEMVVM